MEVSPNLPLGNIRIFFMVLVISAMNEVNKYVISTVLLCFYFIYIFQNEAIGVNLLRLDWIFGHPNF